MFWLDELMNEWHREYPELELSALPAMVSAARLSVLVDAFQNQVLEPFEISPGDYGVLAALRRASTPYRLNPSKLYNRLHRSSGGMTKTLKKLEAAGFVERAPDPEDGRGSLVCLTPRGLELQDRVFNAYLAATESLLKDIDGEQLREIDQAIRTLVDTLER
jgi:DNA-binding MarR family transcriptional regulator